MKDKLIRVYQALDISDIRDHMLIYGDLSGACSKCNELDIKLDALKCPSCETDFRYGSFRNIKSHLPKVQKLKGERPNTFIIDHDDYKRMVGALKAQEFLK